jgi:hypothetical protein
MIQRSLQILSRIHIVLEEELQRSLARLASFAHESRMRDACGACKELFENANALPMAKPFPPRRIGGGGREFPWYRLIASDTPSG